VMIRDEQGRPVLSGDGSYGFQVTVDGDDLVVRDVSATWFGGDSDPQDSGETASGVFTKGHPDLMGCALPMDLGDRSPSTQGSPIPKLPWGMKRLSNGSQVLVPGGTIVRVFSHSTQEVVEIPLIDLGPAKPPAAHAAIDLSVAAFKALGSPLSA